MINKSYSVDIDKAWTDYVALHGKTPNYASCQIVRTTDHVEPEMHYIRIGDSENVIERYKVIAVCRDLDELKALAVPDPERDFTLTECLNFEFREILENKTYRIEIDGRQIPVTTEEVLAFYHWQYDMTEKDIENYGAARMAWIKHYRECDRVLDKALVRRLLDEERLMKVREADGFKLPFTPPWYAELRREGADRYTINASHLDNAQIYIRSYVSMQDALLHCLNGFNENADVPDRYRSIEEYLADPAVPECKGKVAKLVTVSLMTRVIVDQNASDTDILDAAREKFIEKIKTELSEHLESIDDDQECPYDPPFDTEK